MTHWLAELDGRRIRVEVPATSANLGAGYDCIGLALSMTNQVDLEVRSWSRGRVELHVDGEGAGELPADRTNRFVRGLEAALATARGEPPPPDAGWGISMVNRIPLERGLGSSSAATVAGLIAGNALAGERLTTLDLIRLATGIEGHADNVCAAIMGGFVVAAPLDDGKGGIEAIRFDVPRDLQAILFVPDLRLGTTAMRAVLPARVPLADAVANLGHVAIGVAGIATGRYEFLRLLTRDRLHERYRTRAHPQLPALIAAAVDAGAIGACLSGAGSTVIAFADGDSGAARVEAALTAAAATGGLPGRVALVAPRNEGARILGRS